MGNIEKFDSAAHRYDTPERAQIAQIIATAIREYAPPAADKTAVDYGCGTGLVGLNLLDAFASILFADASPKMIGQIQAKLAAANIKNATALCCDLLAHEPPRLHADYIFMAQVLLHIKETEPLLERAHAALNAHGHLLIVDFDKTADIRSEEVHNGFDQTELIEACKTAGFQSAEAKTFYRGTQIFMGKDASMFILHARK